VPSWVPDEARTVRDLKTHEVVVLPMIAELGGRVIDTAGDGILTKFGSVLQPLLETECNEPDAPRLPFRRKRWRCALSPYLHRRLRINMDGRPQT